MHVAILLVALVNWWSMCHAKQPLECSVVAPGPRPIGEFTRPSKEDEVVS